MFGETPTHSILTPEPTVKLHSYSGHTIQCKGSIILAIRKKRRLRTLLKKASELGTSHILVVGDFNYGKINWKAGTMPNAITNPATAIVETLRDLYLYQHITDPTHYRANLRPNTLDLVITNEEGMVDNVALRAPVGKSHHTCISFDFMCYTERPAKITPKFQYHKGNYTAMREDAAKLDWNQEGTDLDEMWLSFMNNIKLLADSHIPKSKPHQINRPIYMTAKAREKSKDKEQDVSHMAQNQRRNDYRVYTKVRNQAKRECWKAEREFEKKLAKECKNNPKALYRYSKSKMKTRSEIAHLTREDSSLTATDKDKADLEELNKFFSSVFTREDTVNMPNISDTKTDVILEDTDLTIDEVDKKLSRLNPNKSAGPDGASPRILKELHTAIAEPLYNIF